MTHKERILRALLHKEVDRIPTQVNYTSGVAKLMAAHFGVSESDLPLFLDNHMIRVDIDHVNTLSADGRNSFDWWGVGWDTNEEGYFASVNPLSEEKDLDGYAWPDPGESGLMGAAEETVQSMGGEYFITPNFGFALFERAWSLRGFEAFFTDMALDPGYTSELLDRIVDIQLELINRFIETGIDGAYFGDDYGAQKGMLFSPRMWDRFIKPRLDKMFTPFRDRGLPILMHSDGNIQKILPGLVEIGLTALNPVQPEVLDHSWLASEFGGKLAFYGGVSTQTVLPNGTPDEVRAAVRQARQTLAPNDTGLLIAPSHRMMTDIPMANVEALLDAYKTLD